MSYEYALFAGLERFPWLCLALGSPNYSSGHNKLPVLPVSNQFSLLECSDPGDDLDDPSLTTQNAPILASPESSGFLQSFGMPLTSTPIKQKELKSTSKPV